MKKIIIIISSIVLLLIIFVLLNLIEYPGDPYFRPPLEMNECSGTEDLIPMCNLENNDFKIVSSYSSCGIDAQYLEEKGWFECNLKLEQFDEAITYIQQKNASKVEFYQNNYFTIFINNNSFTYQKPSNNDLFEIIIESYYKPTEIEIIYLEKNYNETEIELINLFEYYKEQNKEEKTEEIILISEKDKTWISIMPNHCSDPWGEIENKSLVDFLNINSNDYYELEKKHIKEFYSKKEIIIYEIIYGNIKPTCRAKCCPRGDTIYLLVSNKDKNYLLNNGFDLAINQKDEEVKII